MKLAELKYNFVYFEYLLYLTLLGLKRRFPFPEAAKSPLTFNI